MSDAAAPETLKRAESLLAQGKAADSLALCRGALARAPDDPKFLLLAGVAAFVAGEAAAAVPFLERLLVLQPDSFGGWINLGNARQALGDKDGAIAAFRRARTLSPGIAAAHYNLGCMLMESDPEAALAAFGEAHRLNPRHALARYNASLALAKLRRHAEAAAAARDAIAIAPDRPEFHLALANALMESGDFQSARESLDAALRLDPGSVPAKLAHLEMFRLERKFEAVLALFRELPDEAKESDAAVLIYAATLCDLFRPGEAAARLKPLLQRSPDDPKALVILAQTWTRGGFPEQAIEVQERIAELAPDFLNPSVRVLTRSYVEEADRPEMRALIADRARRYGKPGTARRFSAPEKRLRVGFLSATFREHPVARNIIGLLENRDPGVYEAFAYDHTGVEDRMTARLARAFDHWRDVLPLADAQAAELIAADRIDILISLAGWVDGNRPQILTHRPAPIQVSFHDICTSGLDCVDYWLTDPILHPTGTGEPYFEELLRLPCLYLHDVPRDLPDPAPPPSAIKGYPTFGSFNNLAKLSDSTLRLWRGVLAAVPEARLLLKYQGILSDPLVRANLVKRLARWGIPEARVDFHPGSDGRREHLASFGDMDIALDSFPYNGSTTSFEALLMGVPLVTRSGGSFLSRVGLSLLAPLGLADLAAPDDESFAATAAALARDPERLARLRREIRPRLLASPLTDGPAQARAFEAALRRMAAKNP